MWSGYNDHSKLSIAIKLLSIKSKKNIFQRSFDQIVGLMKETHPLDNVITQDFYKTKKLISKLDLTAQKIDCCINGCILYYVENKKDKECKFCGTTCYKTQRIVNRQYKEIIMKRMHYLPPFLG